ncbi:molybdopterin molybdotransferase [Aminobacter lissarensis]|uniref:Molybdopterin molybdenumtransferase n=1 Tax=Aminobacter carboxidus TaxID=376165 RepID=A0A8E1WIA7_9HYPH|nr:gephyrin-like molybdotransferase Glp [Aminobacter lissarensis]MBB6469531.1 molybdopterin molybdotransferase [Aminobacter lissarensis]
MIAAMLAFRDHCKAGSPAAVIPVDIAAAKAVAAATPVAEIETVDLLAANGRVLAAAVRAPMDLPPFDASAMDGYAVRLADLREQGPWRLPISGRIAAGDTPTEPVMGAVRILTGATCPQGFDAVVMQERCRVEGDAVFIAERPTAGLNIRHAGEDVRRGELLLDAGKVITPQHLALLAGQGVGRITVRRKVRIGLISTGSELREPGQTLHAGQIFNSNRVMLRAGLDSCRWAEVIDFGIVPDTREAISTALTESSMRCDAVVTTGGVSAGEEDHVSWAVGSGGGTLDVLKVAMRPGKPVKVGRLGTALFLGLPGNPNAALVTFRMIAMPALRRLAGLDRTGPDWHSAEAGFHYDKKHGRTEFVPVRVSGHSATGLPILQMLGRGSSASLRSIAEAEGIAVLPPDMAAAEPGISVRFERLTWC